MSQYLALIYGNEQESAKAGQGHWDEVHKGHNDFGNTHGAKLAGGNALQGSDTATTIRKDGGAFTVTDGVFAEAKEVLGGYYLIEAADLDEAIAIAKDIPMPFGGVEVRPIQVFE
ncbi:MAG: YCII-related protein [Frankiales bacterium]|nr:YCII-related protein [Frankiales bacterium]